MAEDTPSIEERENGPLIAKNCPRLTDADGNAVEEKPLYALCRCGQSKNKPFCDGSHNDAGFESRGGEPAGRDRVIAYEGTEVTVYYNPLLCSHAAECGRLASNIFNPEQKPWVQPDNGTRAEVEAVVTACPSSALTMSDPGGSPTHLVADTPGISIQKDGPYWVRDIPSPEGPAGEEASPRKYVLCRCGLSGNKPYCDGSHRDAGWKDG